MTELEDRLSTLLRSQQPIVSDPAFLQRVVQRRDELVARRRRWVGTAATVLVLVAVVAWSPWLRGQRPSTGEPASPNASTVLHVTCTSHGTTADQTTVAASSDGVHVVVTNDSGETEAYLNYEDTTGGSGTGGGDPVSSANPTLVLLVPPGSVDLRCGFDLNRRIDPPIRAAVTDPNGYWNGQTLQSALGCQPNAEVDGPAAHAATEQAAVEALLANGPNPSRTTFSRFNGGYRDQSTHTWLSFIDGKGHFTIQVTQQGTGYSAALSSGCLPPQGHSAAT